jgi:hypothetical protein
MTVGVMLLVWFVLISEKASCRAVCTPNHRLTTAVFVRRSQILDESAEQSCYTSENLM